MEINFGLVGFCVMSTEKVTTLAINFKLQHFPLDEMSDVNH